MAGVRNPGWLTAILGGLAVSYMAACGGDDDSADGTDAPSIDGGGTVIDAAGPDAQPPPDCPEGAGVSFADDIQPVFATNCTDTGCHDSTVSAASLDLTEGNAYGNLVGVSAFQCGDRMRVVASDLGQSYLVNKLTGNDMCSGTLMPKAGQPLGDDELSLIYTWICTGAQNN